MITDVDGVSVGHRTISKGAGALVPGRGPVRTGVTAIVPHGGDTFTHKVTAAVHVINGFGKAAGFIQVAECGELETPILLTNTLSVGLVTDAAVAYMLRHNPAIGVTTGTVNAVVGECNDGYLNDIRGRHVTQEDVFRALADARSGPVAEGAVGAGTGMTAFGWKGGIGTASRVVATVDRPAQHSAPGPDRGAGYVLGTLVLSNFGAARDLVIDGWPVGRYLPAPAVQTPDDNGDGSIVTVIATDAPLDERQLRRIATRAVVGLVRTGSRLSHGSGDYVIAFSTTRPIRHTMPALAVRAAGAVPDRVQSGAAPLVTAMWPDDGQVMAALLRAAGEAVEEAIINSLFQADTITGRDGHVRHGLPIGDVKRLLRRLYTS